MSALPPIADIGEGIAECPLMTQSGHCLVLGLRRFYLPRGKVGHLLDHRSKSGNVGSSRNDGVPASIVVLANGWQGFSEDVGDVSRIILERNAQACTVLPDEGASELAKAVDV